MLEMLLDKKLLFVLKGILTGLGVVDKCIVSMTMKRMVEAAGSMSKSNHPLMRLVRAKFEHACMISDTVENVGVFVDKYLYEYKVCGLRLHTLRRLEKICAGLLIVTGLVGAGLSYQVYGMGDAVLRMGACGAGLGILVWLFHLTTDENYCMQMAKNYMVDYLENIYQHRYEKTYKKEVLAEEARSEEARIAERSRTQENAGMTKNIIMPEEARMGENTRTAENRGMAKNARMTEEARMGENTRMPENTGNVKNTRMPENAGRAEGDNLPDESVNQKKQEPKQEFPGSMDSLLWAMYKTEPLQVEDDRKVKKTAISQKPGKTEKIEKTIESEETKAQDEANRNQRIREILEEFMA